MTDVHIADGELMAHLHKLNVCSLPNDGWVHVCVCVYHSEAEAG